MDWIDANGQSAAADDLEEKLSGVLLVPDTRCRFTHFIADFDKSFTRDWMMCIDSSM
jgi:hypothetical protein